MRFFLGLSSEFWSGVTFGLMIFDAPAGLLILWSEVTAARH